MKFPYLIIALIYIQFSFGQDTNGVKLLKDDSSVLLGPKKYMWVGKPNNISTINGGDLLKVWTDNGKVDSGSFYLTNYCIVPEREGIVNVYSIQTAYVNRNWDTITTKNSFTAIYSPNVKTILDKKLLKDSLEIKYSFVYSGSGEALDTSRYWQHPIPPAIKVFFDDQFVGDIEFFNEKEEIKKILSTGNIIYVPSFPIRDSKTDLMFGTPEFKYKYK
jgi:hypothetical protein